MAQTAQLFLHIADTQPKYGVYALTAAAKLLSELQAGWQERDISVAWQLAPEREGEEPIVLYGTVTYRSQWQLRAYLDYIQKRTDEIMDEKKARFRLTAGDGLEIGG